MSKPKKKYRPGPVHCNALQIVLNKVCKLEPSDLMRQREILNAALTQFSTGKNCHANWRSLADAANMAETLSNMGICSGLQASAAINAAQEALAAVYARQPSRGTWTLYPAELEALQWLVILHVRQLAECDYGEFERAFQTTHNRVAQARAGNAPQGAIVVAGDFAGAQA